MLPRLPFLAVTVDGTWRPGIGDPTVLGWATVVAYFAAVVCCLLARPFGVARGGGWSERVVWISLAAVLLLLGVNKQLDLQTWFTEVARARARADGWYERRHEMERAFVTSVIAAGVAAAALMVWIARTCSWEARVALVGAALLTAFVVLRASSFHHVERWLGLSVGPTSFHVLLELAGILCIAAAGAIRSVRLRAQRAKAGPVSWRQ